SSNASAANIGGTKIIVALAPVFSFASATVLKIGQPSCVVPPLPGVTPPTMLVPYAAQVFAWNVPSRPVIPWMISRVDLSTRIAITGLPRQPQLFPLHLSSSPPPGNSAQNFSGSRGPFPRSCLPVVAPAAASGSLLWLPAQR